MPVQGFSDSDDFVKFESARTFFKKGIAFYNKMQYLAAVEFFRKAINRYPEYAAARDYCARAYALAGYTDAAEKELVNLQKISPEDVSVAVKIEKLRLRAASRPSAGINRAELILHETLDSDYLKRFGFRKPADIAIDSEKNIYITSFEDGKISVLSPNGKGVNVIRPGANSRIYGIDHRDGLTAASDFAGDEIYLFNEKMETIKKFGKGGSGNAEFHGPEGICFGEKGFLYVADSGNHRIQKFSTDGEYIFSFGKKGRYEGELESPTDAAYYMGNVYVSDTGNGRIVCFDKSGNHLKDLAIAQSKKPRGLSVHGDTLLISDEESGLILYGLKDETVKVMNSWQNRGRFSGLISSVVDRDGYLYCLDHNMSRAYIFTPVGKKYSNLDLEVTSVDIEKFPVVAFYVNVRDKSGNPVYGLEKNNFRVTEDNAPITGHYVNYLRSMAPSVSVVMCVDRSKSMREYHNDIPWLADFVLKKMKKNDSVKVMNFHSTVWQASPFDWSRRRTRRALQKREYKEGRKIGTVLYNSINDLLPRLNRRSVLLITQGSVEADSFGQYTPDNIIQYARAHYIPVNIISFKEPHPLLERIAKETGGSVIRPAMLDNLGNIYNSVKKSEEYRYVLVYPTFKLPSFKGWWSDVKIDVDYRGQKGTEWGGYFVP